MKLVMTKRNKYLLTGGLLLLTATPSFALFGIGDIVFDPTSYASLVSQLTTLESQYKMLQNNITHFSIKQQWQTTLNAMKNANVANMFGETSGHEHRAQYELTQRIVHGLDSRDDQGQRKHDNLPARTDAGERAALATCHDRGIGLHLSRLPHRSRPVQRREDTELHRKQHTRLAAARRLAMAPTPKSNSSISSMQRKPRRCPRCNRRASCKPAWLHR